MENQPMNLAQFLKQKTLNSFIKSCDFMMNKAQILGGAFICLLICSAWCSLCPSGELELLKYQIFSNSALSHASETYDVLYEYVRSDQDSEAKTLKGWGLNIIDNEQGASFEVIQFQRDSASKLEQKIVFVSKGGHCLIVSEQKQLVVFQTSSNQFVEAQSIEVDKEFTHLQANEDCSMIRLRVQSEQKVYIDSKESSSSLIFQKETVFEEHGSFGLDSFGTFYRLEGGKFHGKKLDPLMVGQVPLQLRSSLNLKALCIVAEDQQPSQFTITIMDTESSTIEYFKKWTADQYSNDVKVHFDADMETILVNDVEGLLHLVRIQRKNGFIETTEITLSDEESLYQQNFKFNSTTQISIDGKFVFLYTGSFIQYFQISGDTLYFLGEIEQNLETINMDFLEFFSTQDDSTISQAITTLMAPNQLKECYPSVKLSLDTSDNSSQQNQLQILQQLQASNTPSIVTDSQGNSLRCPAECAKCSGPGNCQVCSLGYSLNTDTGKCVFCNGCKSCHPSRPTLCFSCFRPQILNSTSKSCQIPECLTQNCQSCTLLGVCEKCHKGYSLVNSECQKCQQGCSSCSIDPTMCDEDTCQVGYVYYANGQERDCVECAAGCKRCQTKNLANCTSCVRSFYHVYDSSSDMFTCEPCSKNCLTCSNGTVCEKCQRGYSLTSSQNQTLCIMECDLNCQTCEANQPQRCLSCFYGSSLNEDNQRCEVDLACNSTQSCLACSDGYVYSEGYCLGCTFTDQNCVGCSESELSECSRCKEGYFLGEVTNETSSVKICIACTAQCQTCLNENSCYACNEGYYLEILSDSVTGQCLECSADCLTCKDNAYMCTSCPQNYTLISSKCLSNSNVQISMTIAIDINQFVTIKQTLMDTFVQLANKFKQNSSIEFSSRNVFFNRLTSSSTVVDGAISADSGSVQAISTGIEDNLASQAVVGGFSIINTQVSVVTDTVEQENDGDAAEGEQKEEEKGSDSNVGLILGVAIPLLILIVFGGVIVFIKISDSNRQLNADDPVFQNNKIDNILSPQHTGIGLQPKSL